MFKKFFEKLGYQSFCMHMLHAIWRAPVFYKIVVKLWIDSVYMFAVGVSVFLVCWFGVTDILSL